MKNTPTGPGIFLNITEAMLPALEQIAEMAAEKILALQKEAADEATATATALPELLTKQEAASILKMSIGTLDKLRKAGHINAAYIGTAVRIPSTEITKYLNQED